MANSKKDLLEAAGFRSILDGDGWGGGVFVSIRITDADIASLDDDQVAELVRQKLRETQDKINRDFHKRIGNLAACLVYTKCI
jgi:hypothetical protein